jgi:hypothetical protein
MVNVLANPGSIYEKTICLGLRQFGLECVIRMRLVTWGSLGE